MIHPDLVRSVKRRGIGARVVDASKRRETLGMTRFRVYRWLWLTLGPALALGLQRNV